MDHNFDFTTLGMVDSLVLMLQGKLEPEIWSENQHMDIAGRIEHYKAEVLDHVRPQYQYAGDTISRYRDATADELRAAQRRFESSLNRLPTSFNEPVFDMWRSFLTDSVEEIKVLISQKEPPPAKEKTVRDEIRELVEAINDLQRDRLQEMEKNPDEADLINRIYRQAIDRLRERV